jgi:hypothetical protein
MKKINLQYLILFLLLVMNCFSQSKINLEYQNDNLINEIGIGLIQQINASEKIILYSDIDCKKLKSKDAKIGKDIIPLLNKIDYSILFFVCIEKNSKSYKIVTSMGKYAYIKPSDKFIFYSWNEFLKNQVTSVESKNKNLNPLFDKINGKSVSLKNIQFDDEIEVITVKENWLNLRNTTIDKTYWLKWKDGNKLLIYLNLLM